LPSIVKLSYCRYCWRGWIVDLKTNTTNTTVLLLLHCCMYLYGYSCLCVVLLWCPLAVVKIDVRGLSGMEMCDCGSCSIVITLTGITRYRVSTTMLRLRTMKKIANSLEKPKNRPHTVVVWSLVLLVILKFCWS